MLNPDVIIRSKRKTLSISIDPFGRLIVRAPYKCSEERIFAFLREKEEWLVQKKYERESVKVTLPSDDLDGYSFLLLGKQCRIVLTDEDKIELKIDENAETGEQILYLPKENAKERLLAWLKVNANRIFTEVTKKHAKEMCLNVHSVSVSSARTRWGSCSYDNKIRYSFRLLFAPKEMVEYVVVHELSHIQHKNHSSAFWAQVGSYIPDYKARRKWLEVHASLMQIF